MKRIIVQGFPVAQTVKKLPAIGRPGLGSIQVWVRKIPWRGHGNSPQYSCLENPHGLRSLAGYSPWGHKESDTAE